jgi:hypothetical protein
MPREFDELYPLPDGSSTLLTYLSRFEPAFLAPRLIECGAIYVQRNGRESVAKDPRSEVRPRDFVYARTPWPAPCEKALRDAAANEVFRDIACVPRSGGDFSTRWKQLLDVRRHVADPRPRVPMTTVLFPMDTIEAFVRKLRGAATSPLRDVLLATHGWASGWLDIPARDGSGGTSYEDLAAALKTGALQVNENLLIPPLKVGGKPQNRAFHIRGCRVGLAEPFMKAFKAALGGNFVVTAPKHWSFVSTFSDPFGHFEYLKYSFSMRRPTPFKDKVEAIKAFQRRGFTWTDGTRVPNDRWRVWIPDDVERHRRPIQEPFANPVSSRGFPLETDFQHSEEELIGGAGDIPLNEIGPDPGTKAGQRTAYATYLAKKFPTYREDHPFPMWQRYELRSMDELMSTFDPQLVWSANKVTVRTISHFYEVRRPVVSMRTGALLMNYYPVVPSAEPVETLNVNDETLFARV